MKDKPTLDELFQSKKLDLPNEDFWQGFQDRVKGQAIASLSRRSESAKIRKTAIYSIAPVLILSLIGLNLFNSEIPPMGASSSAIVDSASQTSSLSELVSIMDDNTDVEFFGAVQLASLQTSDSFTNARIKLAGNGSSFTHRSLQIPPSSQPVSQFTF